MSEIKQLDSILINREALRSKMTDVSSDRLAEMMKADLSPELVMAIMLEHIAFMQTLENKLFCKKEI